MGTIFSAAIIYLLLNYLSIVKSDIASPAAKYKYAMGSFCGVNGYICHIDTHRGFDNSLHNKIILWADITIL